MFAGTTRKRRFSMLLVLLLAICVAVISSAEILMPQATGKKVQKDGNLAVDSSNAADIEMITSDTTTSGSVNA